MIKRLQQRNKVECSFAVSAAQSRIIWTFAYVKRTNEVTHQIAND